MKAEIAGWQRRLRSVESLIAQHEELARRALPHADGLLSAQRQRVLMEVQISSQGQAESLLRHLSEDLCAAEDLSLAGRLVPAGSRLCKVLARAPSARKGMQEELQEVCSRGDVAGLKAPSRLVFAVPTLAFGSQPIPEPTQAPQSADVLVAHAEAIMLASELGRRVVAKLAPGGGLLAACSDLLWRSRADQIDNPRDAERLADVVAAMEDFGGVEWGLQDRLAFARLCKAQGALSPDLPDPPPRPKGVTQPGPGERRAVLDAAVRRGARPLPGLGCEFVSAEGLARVLDGPALPEDHVQLQQLLSHLRHLRAQLRGGGAGSLQALRQEAASGASQVRERQGRLDVMEARLPTPWSPPGDLWTELMGAAPPIGASVEELRAAAQARVQESRAAAYKRLDEVQVAAQMCQARTNKCKQISQ